MMRSCNKNLDIFFVGGLMLAVESIVQGEEDGNI